jgi:hypothetical protein
MSLILWYSETPHSYITGSDALFSGRVPFLAFMQDSKLMKYITWLSQGIDVYASLLCCRVAGLTYYVLK